MIKQCTYPWTGITIDPNGWISLCCNTTDEKMLKHKISDVKSLKDFFVGEEFEYVRSKFKKRGWQNIKSCHKCLISLSGIHTVIDDSYRFIPGKGLQYLEFSTSNICNQTCVTCDSYFSTKWQKLEPLFGRGVGITYRFTDDDIDKIIEVLPGLKELQLKGGEPFMDIKNVQILDALSEVNSECNVIICTNGQNIPRSFLDVIKKNPKQYQIGVSIDGINEIYNWIRGGDWNKTIIAMQNIYDETGIVLNINPCISAFNLSHLREIYDFFIDKSYTKNSFRLYNVVTNPEWASPMNVYHQEQLDKVVFDQFNDIRDTVDCEALYQMKSTYNPEIYEQYIQNTKIMDKIRGFSIGSLL